MTRRNTKPRNQVQEHARERALAALARSRRDKIPISAAAKIEGTRLETVRKYAASALRQRTSGGRIQVTSRDRIARTLNILTPQGPKAVTVRDSRLASRIGEHLNAVRAYSHGDASPLDPFREKSFRAGGVTYPFITDPATLDKLALADSLGIDKLYRSVEGR